VAKAAFDENKDSKRLIPKNGAPHAETTVPVGGAGGSTALEILPSLLRQSKPRASEDGVFQRR